MEGEPPPLADRRRLQEELSEFVESCCRTLQEVTSSLGWSLDRLDPGEAAAAEDEVVVCPYDFNHHMPKSSLAKHMVSCRLRKLGYTKEEEDKMYNSEFFYENMKMPSITLNKDSQFQIIKQARTAVGKDGDYYNQRIYSSLPVEVPLNHKRFVCDLTQADRLALYDFVIEETKKKRSDSQIIENDSDLFVDLAAKVNQDNSRKSPKSYLEILAEVRDYKRRRQSYRAKNVHITKKSYTEIEAACSSFLPSGSQPQASDALEELCFTIMGTLPKPQKTDEKVNNKRFLFHYSKTGKLGNSNVVSSVVHPLLQLVPQLHERRMKRFKLNGEFQGPIASHNRRYFLFRPRNGKRSEDYI